MSLDTQKILIHPREVRKLNNNKHKRKIHSYPEKPYPPKGVRHVKPQLSTNRTWMILNCSLTKGKSVPTFHNLQICSSNTQTTEKTNLSHPESGNISKKGHMLGLKSSIFRLAALRCTIGCLAAQLWLLRT